MTREPLTITIERTVHGYWKCSTVYRGYLVHMTYGGYTKRQARALFRATLDTLTK